MQDWHPGQGMSQSGRGAWHPSLGLGESVRGAGKFSPGQAVAMPTSTVELSVQCKNLANMDFTTKSDPFCSLYIKVRKQGGECGS